MNDELMAKLSNLKVYREEHANRAMGDWESIDIENYSNEIDNFDDSNAEPMIAINIAGRSTQPGGEQMYYERYDGATRRFLYLKQFCISLTVSYDGAFGILSMNPSVAKTTKFNPVEKESLSGLSSGNSSRAMQKLKLEVHRTDSKSSEEENRPSNRTTRSCKMMTEESESDVAIRRIYDTLGVNRGERILLIPQFQNPSLALKPAIPQLRTRDFAAPKLDLFNLNQEFRPRTGSRGNSRLK
mmetsp:Transcript_49869/g.57227  ORF Transcript_49869/g.57227 Transcript_49869/m.57227 type:complete len:242 (-) Transcript_49869:239-964(-)